MSDSIEKYSRRSVLKAGAACAAVSVLPVQPAKAWIPFALRFGVTVMRRLVVPFAKRSLQRKSVTATAGLSASATIGQRASASAYQAHKAKPTYKLTASLGLNLSPVLSVDADIAQKIKAHRAEAIWVNKTPGVALAHELTVYSSSSSSDYIASEIQVTVRDADTNRIEDTTSVAVHFAPKDKISFAIPIDVERLTEGKKIVEGKAVSNGIDPDVSAYITFDRTQRVVVARYNKVILNDV